LASVSPDRDDVVAALRAGQNQVLWTRRIADTDTPVAAHVKLAGAGPSFLLESVEGGERLGRYSFVGLAPDLMWRAHSNAAEINRQALTDPDAFTPCAEPALAALRTLAAECLIPLPHGVPGAVPTLVGYFGYESAGLVEKLPTPKAKPVDVPDQLFIRPTVLLVFDRLKDELTILAPLYAAPGLNPIAAYEQAAERIEAVERALDGPLPTSPPDPLPASGPITVTQHVGAAAYAAMVAKAKDYIAAGDIFQVVLAQRFSQPFPLPAFDLYRALRRVNPSPFLYFLNLPGFALVGSSPEILVRVRDGEVTIRPIAGTRPRGKTDAEDSANRASLLADPKELAEHLMLLDLGRNDVGRVASPASVRVHERFTIEKYSHVMHIVSDVRGRLDPAHDAIDAVLAGFPAGTVSGAPKIRAMEIIHDLEPEARGIYAGGVGYFGADGSVDSCIVLRTAILKDGMMHVQAGAGIVADSDPGAEHRECEAKAGALHAAANEARLVAVNRLGGFTGNEADDDPKP
jgi:anthranilate synthase component I